MSFTWHVSTWYRCLSTVICLCLSASICFITFCLKKVRLASKLILNFVSKLLNKPFCNIEISFHLDLQIDHLLSLSFFRIPVTSFSLFLCFPFWFTSGTNFSVFPTLSVLQRYTSSFLCPQASLFLSLPYILPICLLGHHFPSGS